MSTVLIGSHSGLAIFTKPLNYYHDYRFASQGNVIRNELIKILMKEGLIALCRLISWKGTC